MNSRADDLSRLAAARWEAGRHSGALQRALAEWHARPAQEWAVIESDDYAVRLLDQIIYRFSKLQDAAGERLIPATLAALAELIPASSMHDRLVKLERLGYLNAVQWLEWRAVRNRMSHEYPGDAPWRWAVTEEALAAAEGLLACLFAWLANLPATPPPLAD